MAYRFRREGDIIKHRTHMLYSGVRPWVNDFRHRVVSWHYKNYMAKKARELLLGAQHELEGATTRTSRDLKLGSSGQSMGLTAKDKAALDDHYKKTGSMFHPTITRHFHWKTFIPNIVPFKSSSSPFCRATHNRTGWVGAESRRIADPQPRGGRQKVGGTDDTPPVFPRPR